MKPKSAAHATLLTALERGQTQADIATALGVARSTVQGWASGRYPIPAGRLSKIREIVDGSPVPTCPAHRRFPMPCDPCARAGERNRQIWQTPERRAQHEADIRGRPKSWFPEEERVVRELAGRFSANDIAAKLNEIRARYALPPRNARSVQFYAVSRGLYLGFGKNTYTTNEARSLLGVSWPTMGQWRRLGWLRGHAWDSFWVYEVAEMVEFVQRMPWLVDVEDMQPGPVRTAAEMANRRDPWLKINDLAHLSGVDRRTLRRYVQFGLIEGHKRTGHPGAYMVRASSVHRIRELSEQAGHVRAEALRMASRRKRQRAAAA